MDNLVHSLAGVALAGSLIPASTSAPVRRAVVVAAVVAANAPDLDFAYVWITEAPLGFLLHHRGHTHTLAGAIGLGGLILLALGFWGPVRRDPTVSTARLASIVGLAVSSHLLIDAANVFGVVLWYPFSTTWVFGDISFIFEPWLWVVLGVPIARHAEIPTRVAVLTATTAATAAAAAWSLIPIGILPLLAGVGQSGGIWPARCPRIAGWRRRLFVRVRSS